MIKVDEVHNYLMFFFTKVVVIHAQNMTRWNSITGKILACQFPSV